MKRIITSLVLVLAAGSLPAYVGPGAGITVLGSLLGILATLVVAIGAIVLWPLRRFLKRRKLASTAAPATDSPAADRHSE